MPSKADYVDNKAHLQSSCQLEIRLEIPSSCASRLAFRIKSPWPTQEITEKEEVGRDSGIQLPNDESCIKTLDERS